MNSSRWEVALVLLTGVTHFLVAGWQDLQLVYIVGVSLFWIGYVTRRTRSDPTILGEWGFTRRNLGKSLAWLAPAALFVVITFAIYGALAGHLVLHWHIALIFLLYPFYGLVQQFLVVALLAGNLHKHGRIPKPAVIASTALIFAVAHAPSLPLMAAAFVLATLTTSEYLRTRNLIALGLFHGWFATGLYFFALGRNPWIEVVSARLWP